MNASPRLPKKTVNHTTSTCPTWCLWLLRSVLPASPRLRKPVREPHNEFTFHQWCAWVLQEVVPGALWTSVGHGAFVGPRRPSAFAVAAQLRTKGVKNGVPDILVFEIGRHGEHGGAVELKWGSGGRVSDEQKAWKKALRSRNYNVAVCSTKASLIGARA